MGYAKKMTHEDFLEKFKSVRDDLCEYEFLERYQKSTIKIKTKHITCGYVWGAYPTNFTYHKTKCPNCNNRVKKTQDTFEKEVHVATGYEYKVIGAINGIKRKVAMMHTVCGAKYDVTPEKFLTREQRCPKCFGKHKKTNVQFVKEVRKLVGDEYTPLTQYKNSKQKVLMRHEICKNEWMVEPNKFLNLDTKCPRCADEARHELYKKTHDEFVQEVYNAVCLEYSVLGEYYNFKTKILMRHEECGNEYEVAPSSFLSAGARCPLCTSSKGEIAISKFLDCMGVKYTTQYTDKDCRYDGLLRFDFAILNRDNEKYSLIEYDGIQHYKPVSHWGGEQALISQVEKDSIKNEFCEKHNIPLLRIPYWDKDNIEVLILDFLIKCNILEEVAI